MEAGGNSAGVLVSLAAGSDASVAAGGFTVVLTSGLAALKYPLSFGLFVFSRDSRCNFSQ